MCQCTDHQQTRDGFSEQRPSLALLVAGAHGNITARQEPTAETTMLGYFTIRHVTYKAKMTIAGVTQELFFIFFLTGSGCSTGNLREGEL